MNPEALEAIVIVLEPGHPSTAALAAAAAIAGAPEVRVRGVFIQDENIRRLGALADVREVTIGTAQVRVPTQAALEGQLRADARMARQRFETEAARFALGATFETRQLREVNELLRESPAECFVVIGRARVPAAHAWWDMELTRLLSAGFGGLAFVPAESPWANGGVAFFTDANHDDGAARLAKHIAVRAELGLRALPLATISRPPVTPLQYLVVSASTLGLSRLRDVISTYRCTVVVTR